MTDLTDQPHLYKKGKILKFKNLDPKKPKTYYFSSEINKPSLAAIIKHCNNLNQIVGRCWLKMAKLNSYFGIQRDPSETLIKNKVPFGQFHKLLNKKEGGNEEKILELLEQLRNKDSVTKDQIKDIILNFDSKLEEIRLSINSVIG